MNIVGINLAVALVAASSSTASVAQAENTKENYYTTAATIQAMCASEARPLVKVFASAIVDAHRTYVEAGRIPKKICASQSVTADELADTLCQYLGGHPEMASNSGAQVAIISLVTRWPCKK